MAVTDCFSLAHGVPTALVVDDDATTNRSKTLPLRELNQIDKRCKTRHAPRSLMPVPSSPL
jgi:hypothetical protein